MKKTPKYRVEAIAEAYAKHGIFKPEMVTYSNQVMYEMQEDLNAMKWALNRINEFLQVAEKYDYFTGTLDIAKDELLNRISKYSCPSNLKDEYKTIKNCPLKEKCKCFNED